MAHPKPTILDSDDYSYLAEESSLGSERPEQKKSLFFIIFAILVILSLLVYFIFQFDIILSFARSQTLDDNTITYSNITIVFAEEVLESLQRAYLDSQEREIKACLYGNHSRSDGTEQYLFTDISFPEIVSASVVHITTSMCPQTSLGVLHSHPINRCIASDQDMRSLHNYQESNPESIALIMCNTRRFSIYS